MIKFGQCSVSAHTLQQHVNNVQQSGMSCCCCSFSTTASKMTYVDKIRLQHSCQVVGRGQFAVNQSSHNFPSKYFSIITLPFHKTRIFKQTILIFCFDSCCGSGGQHGNPSASTPQTQPSVSNVIMALLHFSLVI